MKTTKIFVYTGVCLSLAIIMSIVVATTGWNRNVPENPWISPIAPPNMLNAVFWIVLIALQGLALGIVSGQARPESPEFLRPEKTDQHNKLLLYARSGLIALILYCLLFPTQVYTGGDPPGFVSRLILGSARANPHYRAVIDCAIPLALSAGVSATMWYANRLISVLVLPTFLWLLYLMLVVLAVIWHNIGDFVLH